MSFGNISLGNGGYRAVGDNPMGTLLDLSQPRTSGTIPAMYGVYLMETLVGNEIKRKPVVVISNNDFNKGPYCFICPLTTDKKEASATIFKTWATGLESNAIIDNIRSVDRTRLIEYIGQLSTVEQQSLHDCICVLFGINTLQLPEALKDNHASVSDGERDLSAAKDAKIAALEQENKFLKQQYSSLLDKILEK